MPVPTDISGLTHRFRASQLGLVDGAQVSSAAFETGGVTLTQPSFGGQPKYVASSIGGLGGLRFNGTSSTMSGTNPNVINQPYTTTYIFRINAFDANTLQQILYAGGTEFALNVFSAGTYMALGGSNSFSAGLPTVGAHSVTITYNSSAITMYVDGRFAGSGTGGSSSLQDMLFGSLSGGRFFNGDLCEFITYNKVISTAERTSLDTYIQSTYGIQMADVSVTDPVNSISNLAHRLRANKITNYINGASISTTTFEVGAVTLSNASSGNQPTFSTNSINNQAGITFNAASSIWLAGSIPSAINQSFTMTAIVKINNPTDYQEIINATGVTLYINSSQYAFTAGTALTGGSTTTGAHAITIVADPAGTASIYLDGALIGTGSSGSGSIQTTYSFGRNPSASRYFNGDIVEYLVYSKALSASERQAVNTYIQSIYAIPMSDVPMNAVATETWTGANGNPWPSQWSMSQMTGSNGSSSIQGNAGGIFPGATNSTYRGYLSGMQTMTDIDVVVSFTFPVQDNTTIDIAFDTDNTLSTNPSYGNDPQNGYYVEIQANGSTTGGNVYLYREVNSSRAQLGSVFYPPSLTAGVSYTVRAQRFGSTVRAKFWQSSLAEPSIWTISGTDTSSQPSGKVYLSSLYGYAGTSPVLFDNLTVSGFAGGTATTSASRYVRSKDLTSLIITASGSQVANVQTVNYTLATSDIGRVIEMNLSIPNTVTIPPNSSVAIPVGAFIDVCQVGLGQTYMVAGTGVTLDISQGNAVYSRFGTIRLRQRALNEWVIGGLVTPFVDPTTISGLVQRMRASTLGISIDGTAVASMPFEVGGITLTQSTAASQPIWRARGKNGKPYIAFDGVDDFIFLSTGVPAYNQPVTMVAVAQIYNGTGSQELYKAGGLELLLNQSANTWSTYAGSLINSPVRYSGVQSFTGVFGAAGSQGSIQNYTNGVLGGSGGGGGNSTSGGDIYIGTHPQTPRYLFADMYEVLVYNATLSAADIAKLHLYIQANYL